MVLALSSSFSKHASRKRLCLSALLHHLVLAFVLGLGHLLAVFDDINEGLGFTHLLAGIFALLLAHRSARIDAVVGALVLTLILTLVLAFGPGDHEDKQHIQQHQLKSNAT